MNNEENITKVKHLDIKSIIDSSGNTWFKAKDVGNLLGYKNPLNAIERHINEQNKCNLKNLNNVCIKKQLNGNEKNTIYINKQGVEQLVNKNKVCGPDNIKTLIDSFNLNLRITPRKEHYHIEAIEQSFPDVEMQRQFKIEKYRVDLYIEKYNLVIECDEFNHRDRDPQLEKEREDFIKSKLNCEFIRFDPDCKDFSIFSVISRIYKFILDNETSKLKQTIKNKDIVIKELINRLK